jgi:hypothetical protein
MRGGRSTSDKRGRVSVDKTERCNRRDTEVMNFILRRS